ncbi:hypothetical protein [Xylophilus sp. Leaf220]|uniref:hypothetical protein n=1 Tax=Xylophilus sp. Leaf220 TaxID=1735686 RepID=UPI0006FEF5F1|nr:hypothetical protein [Xylophilus sp. Leaf220]KQM68776.1 hypothetical protein ASE76_13850 [Xylophilus sp. Leaf220]
MKSVHELVREALEPVLPNTWAIELPPAPVFPALVFDIDTEPEPGWCAGGGYDQQVVNIVALAPTLMGALALIPTGAGGPVRTAMGSLGTPFMFEEESGDADYEPNPELFARFLIVRLRTPRH